MIDIGTQLRSYHKADNIRMETRVMCGRAADEIERLTLENWQLKGALGYPVPGNIPQGPFKCGLCDAAGRHQQQRDEK